jgi:proteasome lid subunit RPN8/RPN11
MHRASVRAVIEHARRARPRESCGVLVGRDAHVAFAIPMKNVARGRTRYQLDPAEHIALRRVLRELTPAIGIVGVYHSHPRGSAWPSRTDVAQALYPGWIHLIVGLSGNRAAARAFAIERGRVRPLVLRRT